MDSWPSIFAQKVLLSRHVFCFKSPNSTRLFGFRGPELVQKGGSSHRDYPARYVDRVYVRSISSKSPAPSTHPDSEKNNIFATIGKATLRAEHYCAIEVGVHLPNTPVN